MKNVINFTCIVLFMTCSYLVNAQIPEKEKQYLIDFNNSTVGEQWQRKWDLKSDPATWHGVEVANGHVVGLKLYRNNLTGAIPDGISALSHLKSLNLAFNVIEGELPKNLGAKSLISCLVCKSCPHCV